MIGVHLESPNRGICSRATVRMQLNVFTDLFDLRSMIMKTTLTSKSWQKFTNLLTLSCLSRTLKSLLEFEKEHIYDISSSWLDNQQ